MAKTWLNLVRRSAGAAEEGQAIPPVLVVEEGRPIPPDLVVEGGRPQARLAEGCGTGGCFLGGHVSEVELGKQRKA